MLSVMPKKRATYRLEENLLTGMRALAAERRWDLTTVVEVAVEELLKSTGYMDNAGNLTDAAKLHGVDAATED